MTIHRATVSRLRIQALGGFEIFRGNVKMDEDEWDRNQAKTLLKALVTRGPQEFPRDRLMEDLWPESAQDAAQQNFNVTLW